MESARKQKSHKQALGTAVNWIGGMDKSGEKIEIERDTGIHSNRKFADCQKAYRKRSVRRGFESLILGCRNYVGDVDHAIAIYIEAGGIGENTKEIFHNCC